MIGSTFTVFTDHVSLTYIKTLKGLPGKLGRIGIELDEYMMEIKYKPGKEHSSVDCLSRMPIENSNFNTSDDFVNNVNISTQSDLTSFIKFSLQILS